MANDYFQLFKNVLQQEADSLLSAMALVSSEEVESLVELYNRLQFSGGKLVISGVGKSGLIGQKIASTFSSLGLSSIFLHPTEALHGDLGLVRPHDAIVLISHSGNSEELIKLLPFIDIQPENIIALTGNADSAIAQKANIVFNCKVDREACLNNQAPTTSSTLTLAIGDAMAVVYEQFKGLTEKDFAQMHPGGFLGKSMRLKVSDIMLQLSECPIVEMGTTFKDVLLAMTNKPTGMCLVVEQGDKLMGAFVEGDVRRAFNKTENVNSCRVEDIMNPKPVTIDQDELAYKALQLMEQRDNPISVLPVMHEEKLVGQLRLHDLLKQGLKR